MYTHFVCNNFNCNTTVSDFCGVTECNHIFCRRCSVTIRKSSVCIYCLQTLSTPIFLRDIKTIPDMRGYDFKQSFSMFHDMLAFIMYQRDLAIDNLNIINERNRKQYDNMQEEFSKREMMYRSDNEYLGRKVVALEKHIMDLKEMNSPKQDNPITMGVKSDSDESKTDDREEHFNEDRRDNHNKSLPCRTNKKDDEVRDTKNYQNNYKVNEGSDNNLSIVNESDVSDNTSIRKKKNRRFGKSSIKNLEDKSSGDIGSITEKSILYNDDIGCSTEKSYEIISDNFMNNNNKNRKKPKPYNVKKTKRRISQGRPRNKKN